MQISFTGSLTRSFASAGEGKPPVAVLKVDRSGSLSVNGEPVDFNRDGIAQVRLTPSQTAAFNAISPAALVVILTDTREITLPDAHKGRHVTLGDDLLAAALAAAGATESDETGESGVDVTPDSGNADTDAPAASDEAPAKGRKSAK